MFSRKDQRTPHPIARKPLPHRPFLPAVKDYFVAELDTGHADLVLLLCCFISGLVDSTVFNSYSTFVSMQTGNTIFVALGVTGQDTQPFGWAISLASICFFIMGSFLFARFIRSLGSSRRGTHISSFLIQTILILIAAELNQSNIVDGRVPPIKGNPNLERLAPVALLSLQAAGQIVESRALNVGEIPTVVVTSLLCDLISDAKLFSAPRGNIKRNRRIAAFVLTLLGAIAGGLISKVTHSVQASLWVAGILKFSAVISWALCPAKATNVATATNKV